MKKLIDNLPWLLMALTAVAFLGYNFWWKERPQAGGQITGDFVQARDVAAQQNIPLLLVVDQSPH